MRVATAARVGAESMVRLAIGRVEAAVECGDEKSADLMGWWAAELPAASSGAHVRVRYTIVPLPGGYYQVARDGVPLDGPLSPMWVLAALRADLVRLLCAVEDRSLVHAAAVARSGGAVLLVGVARSGKTTLAAALLQRAGWSFLGDWYLPVDGAGRVTPCTAPLRLREGGLRSLGPLPPDWSVWPAALGGGTQRVFYVRPPPLAPGARRHWPVERVIFPSLVPRPAPAACRRVPAGLALLRLLSQTHNRRELRERAFATAAVLARVPCYRLTTARPVEAAALVEELRLKEDRHAG